jgi:hypothetical protein
LTIRSGELQAAISATPPVAEVGRLYSAYPAFLAGGSAPITQELMPHYSTAPAPADLSLGAGNVYSGPRFFVPVQNGGHPREGAQTGFWITSNGVGLGGPVNGQPGSPSLSGGWLFGTQGWTWIPGGFSPWQSPGVSLPNAPNGLVRVQGSTTSPTVNPTGAARLGADGPVQRAIVPRSTTAQSVPQANLNAAHPGILPNPALPRQIPRTYIPATPPQHFQQNAPNRAVAPQVTVPHAAAPQTSAPQRGSQPGASAASPTSPR